MPPLSQYHATCRASATRPSPPFTKAAITASTTVPRTNDASAAWTFPIDRPSPELIGAWRAIRPPTNAVSATASPRSISPPSLRVEPVGPDAGVHRQRRVEVGGRDHLAAHDVAGG